MVEAPGVARDTVRGAVGHHAVGELRQGGLTNDDRAGGLDPLRHNGIDASDRVLHGNRAVAER